ncbi:hypothetical protein V6N13_058846 [Hibiscus sabdariffa]
MGGGMEANKNRFIEDWSSARENLEHNFRWTRRNFALVGIFGIAIPVLVYKGIVREFHMQDEDNGRPYRKFLLKRTPLSVEISCLRFFQGGSKVVGLWFYSTELGSNGLISGLPVPSQELSYGLHAKAWYSCLLEREALREAGFTEQRQLPSLGSWRNIQANAIWV